MLQTVINLIMVRQDCWRTVEALTAKALNFKKPTKASTKEARTKLHTYSNIWQPADKT